MSSAPRLILLASDLATARLRDESGCRALRRGGDVLSVSIDSLRSTAGGEASAGIDRFAPLLQSSSSQPRPPLVALCIAEHPGAFARYCESCERLANQLLQCLQSDRVPVPTRACVVVAPSGLNTEDRRWLAQLTDPRPSISLAPETGALRHLFPHRMPVYLMAGVSRVDARGRAWDSALAWPVAVGRLLGSLAVMPERSPGLRAWRAIALDSRSASVDALDVEALALVNEALGSTTSDLSSARRWTDLSAPLKPPSDRIPHAPSPVHAEDRLIDTEETRPVLPDFSAIAPADSQMVSPMTSHSGGASAHTRDRLEHGPRSLWAARRAERGRAFMADRTARLLNAAQTLSGPKGVISTVWSRIHHTAFQLRWFAGGGFFQTDPSGEFERLSTQMRRWGEIATADRAAESATIHAKIEAFELDFARSYFLSIYWRMLCALAASLFATAAFCVPASAWGGRFVMILALAAGGAAAVTTIVLAALEFAAGDRGRASVERASRSAEQSIAIAFERRLVLGADGELLQRSVAWLQSAARVRDAAQRLLALRDSAVARMSPGDLSSRDPDRVETLAEYRESTTISCESDASAEFLVRGLRKSYPHLVQEQAEELELDWRRMLLELDPGMVGGVNGRALVPMLEASLEQCRDVFRQRLLKATEESSSNGWLGKAAEPLAQAFGPTTDFCGLSVPTMKARGNPLQRVTLVIAPTDRAVREISKVITDCSQGSTRPIASLNRIDGWSGYALVIDEISVRIDQRPSSDSTLRLLEGIDPGETVR
jgi:hypothetical protein